VLKSLERDSLKELLKKALSEDLVLKSLDIKIKEDEALMRFSGGDARKLLNVLEIVINAQASKDKIVITNNIVTSTLQENIALYDKGGEQHYDIISAFIKSIRGSDPNAAVYWLARMLEGGEDIKFIARRLLISASEDIGLANPNALLLAQSCFNAVSVIGMPEARIILSETTIYLATSPKSNSAYLAIDAALAEVKKSGMLPVPLHLRNAPTNLMKELNYGDGYKYSHDYPGHFVKQEFLPKEISNESFWKAAENKRENDTKQYMQSLWKDKYSF
jgi:putative ATPase